MGDGRGLRVVCTHCRCRCLGTASSGHGKCVDDDEDGEEFESTTSVVAASRATILLFELVVGQSGGPLEAATCCRSSTESVLADRESIRFLPS